jgi:hypothetical protein
VFAGAGTSAGDSVAMAEESGDAFAAIIPAGRVTEQGLWYEVISIDRVGNSSSTGVVQVTVDFPAGTQTLALLAGSAQTAYRMISAPNILDSTDVMAVLTNSELAEYDTTQLRLFEYRNERNVELDSTNQSLFRFDPGKAYWVITSQDRNIDFGKGRSMAPERQKVNIEPGWNQIADPFAFAVAWDTIYAASGRPEGIQKPSVFENSYLPVDILRPYQGYFIYNPTDAEIDLVFPPVAASETASAQLARRTTLADDRWQIQISATADHAIDDYNFLGVAADAEAEWDKYDFPEPPPIGQYISLYFPQSDWSRFANRYTTSYVADGGGVLSWNMQVETNVPDVEAELVFAGMQSLPTGYAAMLVDDKLQVRQNLSVEPVYRFPTGSSGTSKTLAVFVGEAESLHSAATTGINVPQTYQLSQNFPNPFNPSTAIRFGLPEPNQVTIRIYDLLGQEVVTLLDEVYKPTGYHTVNWRGTNDYGHPVASGMYLYRITAGAFRQTRRMLFVK